jgi:Nucleotide-diphospho-sugar transferase
MRNNIVKAMILISLFFLSDLKCAKKMKMYSFYTPSHDVLRKEWFLPSIKDDFDLVVKYYDQLCESAKILDDGWNDTMLKKVDMLIEATQDNWGQVFIYADIDIQFFKPIQTLINTLIKDKDLVIQRDNPQGGVCAGFFACRANEKTLMLWKCIKSIMVNKGKRDQEALYIFIKKNNFLGILWDYLPVTFFGGGTLTGDRWKPGDSLPVPHGIVLHHANYVVGVPGKIAQLEYVKNSVRA